MNIMILKAIYPLTFFYSCVSALPGDAFFMHVAEDTLRYVLSRLGRAAQQKYVIYFHPQPGGPVDLYTLRARNRPRNLVALAFALERAGIPFSTLVPLKNTTIVFIIDLDRDLRDKILKAARTLHAPVSSQAGKAKLFGDDIRKQAQTVFEQDIKNYEQKNPNLPPTCDARKTTHKKHKRHQWFPWFL